MNDIIDILEYNREINRQHYDKEIIKLADCKDIHYYGIDIKHYDTPF